MRTGPRRQRLPNVVAHLGDDAGSVAFLSLTPNDANKLPERSGSRLNGSPK
jgi:hypothetical protein